MKDEEVVKTEPSQKKKPNNKLTVVVIILLILVGILGGLLLREIMENAKDNNVQENMTEEGNTLAINGDFFQLTDNVLNIESY